MSVYRHLFLRPSETFIGDHTVDKREKRIVATLAHIEAGMYLRAPLPYENRSGRDLLPGVHLDTETLGVAVSTVLGTSYAFLVRHDSLRAPLEIQAG